MNRLGAMVVVAVLCCPQAVASPVDFLAANWLSSTWESVKAKGAQAWDGAKEKGAQAWESTKAAARSAWTAAQLTSAYLGTLTASAAANTAQTVQGTVAPNAQPQAPPKPPEVVCAEHGLAWDGSSCVQVQAVEELPAVTCANQGGAWDGAQCRHPAPPQPRAQPQSPCQPGAYYDAVHGECWRSKQDYDIQSCADSGRVWYQNSCRTEDQVAVASCQAEGGQLNGDDRLCYLREDVAVVCEEQGALWVASDKRCYVGNAGDIPRGLEKFYFVVRTPQEKALYGAYRDALTKSLYDREAAVREAVEAKNGEVATQLADQEEKLRTEYEAKLADLDAESAKLIDDLGRDFDARVADYDTAVEDYEKRVSQLQQVNQFLRDRLDRSQYAGSTPPSGALGALQRMTGGGADDVELTFPNGMPTPVQGPNGWVVTVPVSIHFPALKYEEASVVYRADKLVYTFSSNGGNNDVDGEQELDFEADGGHAQSYQVRVQGAFPKGSNAYRLELRAALMYTESYAFEDGGTYDLPSVREAPPLTRTFYTSANPLGRGAAPESIQAYEPGQATSQQAESETGTQPGGTAGALNWAAEQRSQLDQSASNLDRNTGFGLRFLVRYMEWIFAAIAVVVAYFLGYLDFIAPLKRLRNRNKPQDPFDLDADFLEAPP